MTSPNEWLVQLFPRLRMQARMLRMDPRLKARFDSSDLVNETLLKAQKNLDQCRAQTPEEMMAWLQAILRNQLRDLVERHHAEIRDVNRERSLNAVLAESSAQLEAILSRASTPPTSRSSASSI